MSSYDPFDETRKQVDQIRRWARTRRRVVLIAGSILILVIFGWRAYYQVEAEERAIVLRFGKHVDTTDPGLHFKLPWIDEVIMVPVARQLRKEFGFRTARAGVQSEFVRNNLTMNEARMLTADLNVGTVEWIVQYMIAEPEKYIFNFRDIDATIRLMAEAAMRSVVGDYTIDELITEGRVDIEREAHKRLKDLNDLYDTGLVIQFVKLKRADVPDQVKPALSEVEEAKQEKARLINEAEKEYNKVIPRAKGRADQMIAAAQGYAAERINEANGDAKRFKAIYSEYKKAKEVTRTRLYFESLSKILPKAKRKILLDPEMKGLIPLLNLSEGKAP